MVKQCRKGDVMNEKTKQYAIYHLIDSDVAPKDVAKELGLTVKEVKDIVKKREDETKKTNKIKTTTSKVNSKNLMIRETAGKGTKSVAIMTKAASEINDQFKKSLDQITSRTAKNAIHRPIK